MQRGLPRGSRAILHVSPHFLLIRDWGNGMAAGREEQGNQPVNVASSPLFLAIDQGGHASRVLVFDRFGEKIVEARWVVAVRHPRSDWVEQDADALLQSVQSALVEALDQLGERRQFLVAAGLVTQRSNIVCWDRNTGRALSPAISWQDRRAQQWMQNFEPQRATIRRITGLVPSAHYGVSKIHWCLENLAEVKTARAHGSLAIGPLASFLLFRLLQQQPFVVDAVNASRTLLWDRTSRSWSAELLTLFSLDADYLPRSVPNRYEFGTLNVAGCMIPLTVCSGDQSAALFSLGIPKPGSAYLNMGTGAFMQCLQGQQSLHKKLPTRLLQSVVWDEVGTSLQVLEATVNGAGSALAVIEKETGISTEQSQRHCVQWLAGAKNIPLYLNGVAGLGSPFWVPEFDSHFVVNETLASKTITADPVEKWVAVLESIVFLLKVNLEEMQSESVAVQYVVISGGLSQLDGLCQRLSDVSGLPVIRPQQCEATAKGLAFLLLKTLLKTLAKSALQNVASEKDSPEKIDREWDMGGAADHFAPEKNTALRARYRQWRVALDDALREKIRS